MWFDISRCTPTLTHITYLRLSARLDGLQGRRMENRPLIVHACTSSQNSLTTGQFFQYVQAYFTSQPPPFRVILGAYPKYQGHNIVHSKQMLAARSALAEAKFVTLCTALKAAGKDRVANKLYAGWKVSCSMCCFVSLGGHHVAWLHAAHVQLLLVVV